MPELGLQAALVVPQEAIVVSLDLQGTGTQSAGYAGYIKSIPDRRWREISPRPYKHPRRPTHRRGGLSGSYHVELAPIRYTFDPSVPKIRY